MRCKYPKCKKRAKKGAYCKYHWLLINTRGGGVYDT